MKRQILFRAKTLNEGEWVQSMTIANGTIERKMHNLYMEVGNDKWKGVDPDTLGQYTGVDDVNGKWIFEGDIVYWRSRNYVVKFWNGMFYASVKECNKDICGGFPLHALTTTADKDDKCAVVGNVFDNPLLLEQCPR